MVPAFRASARRSQSGRKRWIASPTFSDSRPLKSAAPSVLEFRCVGRSAVPCGLAEALGAALGAVLGAVPDLEPEAHATPPTRVAVITTRSANLNIRRSLG